MIRIAPSALRVGLLAATLAACHHAKDEPGTPADSGGRGAAVAPAETGTAQAPTSATSRADPGPILKRTTGTRAAEARPRVELHADARQVWKGATFVQVPVPDDVSSLVRGAEYEAWLVVRGDTYGLAIPAGEGRTLDRPLMFVRFPGDTAPDSFEVAWYQGASADGKPGQTQILAVDGVRAAATEPDVAARFHDAASRWFDGRGSLGFIRRDAFYTFAGARVQALGKGKLRSNAPGLVRRANRTDVAELMNLYTGMTSVEEALQTDRGLLQRDIGGPRELPLTEVKALDLPGHPWDAMIAELPGGPQPVIEPLAAYVPADMLYVHFHDPRTLARLSEDIESLLTPMARAFEERSGDEHLSALYEDQLAIERLGLAKTLGHLAARGVAIVASDPFFREGTDLTLLFHVQSQQVLDAALAEYERRVRARHPDASDSTYTLGTHVVRLLSTPDRAVRQHRLTLHDETLGDVVVVSNSGAALSRVVDAAEGRRVALKDSGDFRYFRARFPYDEKTEDGFGFLSDAFVTHVTGPRVKILQARRMQAAADLAGVAHGALLHGWLAGQAPRDAAQLLASGVLDATELTHSAGEGSITFDPATGPRSKAWGTLASLTPLIELPLDRVSAIERSGYDRFRETYQNYWRGYIDPIGVRIVHGPNGIRLDARMMPLLQNTGYDEIAEAVGDKRVLPPSLEDGMRLTMAVSESSSMRRELDQLSRVSTGNRDLGLGWLGDWVMVGFADRSGLWDMALSLGEVPSVDGQIEKRDPTIRKQVFARAPIYVGAHVRDKLALAATLTALKTFVESAAPGIVDWQRDGAWRDVPVVTVRETLSRQDGETGVAVYYAIVKDVLLLSLDRATLEMQMDAVLDGRTPKVVSGDDVAGSAQGVLALRPTSGQGWLARTALGILEKGIEASNHAAFRAFEGLARGLGDRLPGPGDARRAVAMGYLGALPAIVHGGHFEMVDGLARHTLYGTETEPASLEIPTPASPVSAFIQDLDRLQLGVSIVGEGRHRGLATQVLWERRAR